MIEFRHSPWEPLVILVSGQVSEIPAIEGITIEEIIQLVI